MQRFQGLIGILVILGIAWLVSNNKKKINYRLVFSGILLQVVIALLILKVPIVKSFFQNWVGQLHTIEHWAAPVIESNFTAALEASGLKKGDVLLPLRIILVGGKFGPGVFDIAEVVGRDETQKRVELLINNL